jgi:hypothetical protein
MSTPAPDEQHAMDALLTMIVDTAASTNTTTGQKAPILLQLAEAYAWLRAPDQPHGPRAA